MEGSSAYEAAPKKTHPMDTRGTAKHPDHIPDSGIPADEMSGSQTEDHPSQTPLFDSQIVAETPIPDKPQSDIATFMQFMMSRDSLMREQREKELQVEQKERFNYQKALDKQRMDHENAARKREHDAHQAQLQRENAAVEAQLKRHSDAQAAQLKREDAAKREQLERDQAAQTAQLERENALRAERDHTENRLAAAQRALESRLAEQERTRLATEASMREQDIEFRDRRQAKLDLKSYSQAFSSFKKLTDPKGLEAFLQSFEEIALLTEIPRERWVVFLTPLLDDSSATFRNAMPDDTRTDYDAVKEGLLNLHDFHRDYY